MFKSKKIFLIAILVCSIVMVPFFNNTNAATNPSSPSEIRVTTSGTGNLSLSWDDPYLDTSAINYAIYRSTTEGTLGILLYKSTSGNKCITSSGCWYTDVNVEENVNYYYTIRSINSSGMESQNTEQVMGNLNIPSGQFNTVVPLMIIEKKNTSNSSVQKGEDNQEIARFVIKVYGHGMNLKSMTFKYEPDLKSNEADFIKNMEIVDKDGILISGDAYYSTSFEGISFSNINKEFTVGEHEFILKTTIPENFSGTSLRVGINNTNAGGIYAYKLNSMQTAKDQAEFINYRNFNLNGMIWFNSLVVNEKKIITPIDISVNNNSIQANGEASMYWNTNVEATCNLTYGESSSLANGITVAGSIIQYPTTTNDGKAHYYVQLKNLSTSLSYYYKITCSANGQSKESSVLKLTSNTLKPDLTVKDIIEFNGKIRVKYTNIGSGYANEEFKISLSDCSGKLTQDGSCSAIKIVYKGAAMNPNEERYEDFNIYGDGAFNLLAKVDDSNIVDESNENNNTLTKTITIQTKVNDDSIDQIYSRANDLFQNKLDSILAELNQLRDTVKEQKNEIKYLRSLVKDLKNISEKVQDVINNFITYGVDDNTKKLGEGERAAVIHSYKAAFNKLPETEEELADTIKIANGRWPSMTNEEAEKAAKKQFEKIYKHIVDMDNPHDNAAITVMAYGLRQKAENRNLSSEQQGIKIFKGIYGHNPSSTEDWNMMQAITYSGASRGKDSDGDLLIDEREAQLKTDPKNPDTDGDGYKDGEEVANGYDPLKK